MQTLRRAIATGWLIAVTFGCWKLLNHTAEADRQAPPVLREAWSPPSWHPAGDRLSVLPEMEGEAQRRGPTLRSRSVFLYDLDSGEVLVSRAADDRRPVASLTKLVSSLAMASEAPDLDEIHCIDSRFYPTRNGAKSHFSTGECYRGWDYLGAAMVASDNRAAYGLQVSSGLRYDDFIERMDEVSEELSMTLSTWADPSGLEDENFSTARDIARAAVAVAYHPLLDIAATAPSWRIARVKDAETRSLRTPSLRTLFTTDRLLARKDLQIFAAKTGYTDTAGYCFTAVMQTPKHRNVVLAILGAPKSNSRWRDVATLIDWADEQP